MRTAAGSPRPRQPRLPCPRGWRIWRAPGSIRIASPPAVGLGAPGARAGSAKYAKTVKQAFRRESPQWSNLRQAAFLHLVGHDPATQLPAVTEAERIRAFLGGEGKGLAEVLFNPTERALMNSYAGAVTMTHMPGGGRLPDGGRASHIAQQIMNIVAGGVGFKLAGPGGGSPGAAGARVARERLPPEVSAPPASPARSRAERRGCSVPPSGHRRPSWAVPAPLRG